MHICLISCLLTLRRNKVQPALRVLGAGPALGFIGTSVHPSLKHDGTPWVNAQEGRQRILSFVTSTSKLAPASVISSERILRSWRWKPLLCQIYSQNSVLNLFFCVSLDFFYVCDLYKQSGTSLCHILWTDLET